jgi:transcriptional regulator with GAF, ATPase, and Fis domain
MSSPRTRTPAATKPAPSKEPVNPRVKSALAQHGDAAKLKAERALLLKTLRAQAWNLSATARALGMTDASSVLRGIARYDLTADYERARK